MLATAASQRWEPVEALRVLLEAETKGRAEAAIRTRRKRSGLPAGKTFEAWEEEASTIPAATQQALRTLEWVERGEDLCVCGPSGTGKSHFVEALGHLAIDRGKTVAWHTLESLEALLRGHRADGSVVQAGRSDGHRWGEVVAASWMAAPGEFSMAVDRRGLRREMSGSAPPLSM